VKWDFFSWRFSFVSCSGELSLTIRKLRPERMLFFQITQNQPPKFAGGGLQKAFQSIGIDGRSARRTDNNYEADFVVVWIGMKP